MKRLNHFLISFVVRCLQVSKHWENRYINVDKHNKKENKLATHHTLHGWTVSWEDFYSTTYDLMGGSHLEGPLFFPSQQHQR